MPCAGTSRGRGQRPQLRVDGRQDDVHAELHGTGRAATSVKSGAAPAGISVRAPGGTRYRPAAHGSMSAASSSTVGSAPSDRIAAMAAGPPAR